MKQSIRKKVVVVVSTVALVGLGACIARFGDVKVEQTQVADLELSDGTVIKPWHNEEDDVYYYFIPSYMNLGDASFASDDLDLEIDGKELKEHEQLKDFEIGKNYSLKNSTSNKFQSIQFRKSENVSTMYIRTTNEALDKVMNSKSAKEIARVTVVDEDGNVDLDTTNSKIKTRGNSTSTFEKKPLSILFEKQESILKMKASDKWALLSNVLDYSGIRNKMVYDAAAEIGMESTPETEYVELYLNGDYRGLYLLAQAPDTFYEWSDVDEDGLYMFTAEVPDREKNTQYPIWTENDEALVDVCLPENMHAEERNTANKIIEDLDAVISEKNDDIVNAIDLDSWAKKYLLDEVFIEFDSGIASSYFYTSTNSDDTKVYAGPIWDYDNALGNINGFYGPTIDPEILYAKNEYRNRLKILWYADLYNNPVFYDRTMELFNESMAPVIEELLDDGIDNYQEQIKTANDNNDLRWNIDSDEDIEYVKNYLAKRYSFLQSVWQNQDGYSVVIGKDPTHKEMDVILYVKNGETAVDSEYYDKLFGDAKLYIEGTGEEFDPKQPLYENITVTKGKVNSSASLGTVQNIIQKVKSKKDFVEIIASVLLMIGIMVILSIKNKPLLGRRVYEH